MFTAPPKIAVHIAAWLANGPQQIKSMSTPALLVRLMSIFPDVATFR
jgi:hypothetical protein